MDGIIMYPMMLLWKYFSTDTEAVLSAIAVEDTPFHVKWVSMRLLLISEDMVKATEEQSHSALKSIGIVFRGFNMQTAAFIQVSQLYCPDCQWAQQLY